MNSLVRRININRNMGRHGGQLVNFLKMSSGNILGALFQLLPTGG